MANIEPEINNFQNAVLGEEVRGSMITLARKLNSEIEAGTSTIDEYTVAITQAIASANDAASDANTAAGSANSAASAANSAASAANTARNNVLANETARQNAETARQSAEQERIAAEQSRVAAEQGRVAAETSRAGAESDRANAESQRAAAEQGRAAAEATRVSAEAERTGNEAARVANENLRIAQERDRVNAETERQRAFNNMSQAVLPPASTTTLGGIIVGSGLSVDTDGKVDVVGGGDIETATHAAATYATKDELADKANASHVHAASDITSGTLPVARGGTGLSASPSMLTNLGSTTAANVMQASPRPGITGTLPVANGGTGVTSNPSLLTNLGSTSADDVLKASPRPGVTGTLPVANGGTGATTAAGAVVNIVDGQAIEPASVAATGEVTGKNGTTTHTLSDKVNGTALAVVESTTATMNHPVGDTFMFNGDFVRAAVAIAAGETITSSKVTKTTVNDKIANVWNNTTIYRGNATGDYNDYKEVGIYGVSGGMTDNKPEASSSLTGMLIVYPNAFTSDVATLVLQLYFATSSKAFFRIYGNVSGWTPWRQLATA